jgi:hypothetical protein
MHRRAMTLVHGAAILKRRCEQPERTTTNAEVTRSGSAASSSRMQPSALEAIPEREAG